jgi:hypothetical protein
MAGENGGDLMTPENRLKIVVDASDEFNRIMNTAKAEYERKIESALIEYREIISVAKAKRDLIMSQIAEVNLP